ILISHKVADKYFPDIDPVGQTLMVDGTSTFEVTGVFEDLPDNISFDCQMIASFSSTVFSKNLSWSNASFETFCAITKSANKQTVEQLISNLYKKNFKKNEWLSIEAVRLQPFDSIHLYSANFKNTYLKNVDDISQIEKLAFLSLLVLGIACINYTNLVTSSFQGRTVDMFISRVFGASRSILVSRYYLETILLFFLALFASSILSIFFLPLFEDLIGRQLQLINIFTLPFFIGLSIVIAMTTLLAGFYPAMYLSGIQTIHLIRRSTSKGGNRKYLRKVLVAAQLVVTLILIILSVTVYKQLNYVEKRDLGYNPKNLLIIPLPRLFGDKNGTLLETQLKSLSGTLSVCRAQGYPGEPVSGRKLSRPADDETVASIQTNNASGDILKVLETTLISGKTLSDSKSTDDNSIDVVLNESAIAQLGWSPEEAIGQKVKMQLGDSAYVVGVMRNFNYASLQFPIGPYAFENEKGNGSSYLLVRPNRTVTKNYLNNCQRVFENLYPGIAFEPFFQEEINALMYSSEQRVGKILITFSMLSILIACLGLIGLVAHTLSRRYKEMGIRKVLGANPLSLAWLLLGEFFQLVGIAVPIGLVVSWYLATMWLENFAFKEQYNLGVALLAIIASIALLLSAISIQIIRASFEPSAKILRDQ
ncbi:MAG TPA: FtsX-like permease family protein, partial [Flavitalea sp.]|nr:FtsX-like permease family protein [Flavitalea sp.]